jgi:hypothetical protein
MANQLTPSYNPVAQEARGLAALGRGGDTMLVHMSPEEVSGLRNLALQNGTDLTINPDTGLPEAKRLKKLFRAIAPVLPFLIPGVGSALGALGAKAGLSALAAKSLAAGVIGGFAAPGKGFNFKQGLKTGLMAYGLGSIQQGMQANQAAQANQATQAAQAGQAGATATAGQVTPAATAGTANMPIDMTYNIDAAASPIEALAPPPAAAASPVASAADIQAGIGGTGTGPAFSGTPLTSTPGPGVFPESTYAASAAPAAATGAATGAAAPAAVPSTFEQYTGMKPTTAILGATLLSGAMQGDEEEEAYKREMARLNAEEERKRALGEAAFARSLGRVQQPVFAAGGGIVALAGGGMPTFEYGGTTAPTGEPRMVRGAGDGMSDNVPATIEGVQEARLANDEFVVPADVVADIGNGSSNAGAEKLYAMMDRIRKARHGTTKQPPEINAERYMPV